jgi:hypothetical protein
MTKEERAKIARENGSKSQGPTSDAGKAKSSRNGIKTGDFADKLAAFVPPDSAVLCNEQRQAYFNLVDQLTQIYAPINQESMNLVRQIAIARWQIERLHTATTNVWNFALLKAGGETSEVVEEMEDVEAAARAVERLFSRNSPIEKMSRQIDRLELRIARLRNGIKDIHKNFPNVAKPIENKSVPEEKEPETPKSEPTVYVTERDPEVLAAYRREFPNHKIVLLPADNVAKGIDIEDDLPPAPRKAA